MLRDSLEKLYQKVLFAQFLAVLGLAVIALIAAELAAAGAVLVGGSVALAGGGIYALIARESKHKASSGSKIFARHIVAEASKVVLIMLLTLSALATGWFLAGWLVAGLVVALLGHGLAVFIIR